MRNLSSVAFFWGVLVLAAAVLACNKPSKDEAKQTPAAREVATPTPPPKPVEVPLGTERDLWSLAIKTAGRNVNWAGDPAKVMEVHLNDDGSASIDFRMNNADSADLIRQYAILDFRRLAKALFSSQQFRTVGLLAMAGYWRFAGRSADSPEVKFISTEMPRDVARTVPWRTIGVNDFEGVLRDNAQLWKHAQLP